MAGSRHELRFKPQPRPMQPDRDGIDADAQDGRDVGLAEHLPGDEPQELLIRGTETRERLHRWAFRVAEALDLRFGLRQTQRQSEAPQRASPLVRQDAACHAV